MKMKYLAIAIAALGFTQAYAAHSPNHETKVSQQMTQSSLINISNSNELTVDSNLTNLKSGDVFSINLGKFGKYNLMFEHKTAKIEGVQYLEATLLGDAKQRLSLKNDNGAWTGSFVTSKLAMTIGQANGKSYISNMGKSYDYAMNTFNQAPIISAVHNLSRGSLDEYKYKDNDASLVTHPIDIKVNELSTMKLNSEQNMLLPTGEQLSLVYDTKDEFKGGGTVWSAYSKQDGIAYRTTLVYGSAGVYGVINTPSGSYDVESKDGKSWIVDVKASKLTAPQGIDSLVEKLPSAATAVAIPKAATSTTTSTTTTTTTVPKTKIDVLFTYDLAFFDKYKATTTTTSPYPESGPELKIKSYIAIANQAYIDSGIDMYLNPVGFMKFANDTVSTLQKTPLTALNEMISGKYNVVTVDEAILQQKGGTTAASMKVWRDRLQADVVIGFTPYKKAVHGTTCGLAYLGGSYMQGVNGVANAGNSAYAFVGEGVDTASGSRCLENVLPHEIGHLMGADHDRITVGSANYNTSAFSYGYGYRSSYGGTIMAYAYPRFNIFSSPTVMKCGGTTGVVCGTATENNSRVLNETKQAVSNYRLGYNDPAVKVSGTVAYYGTGIPNVKVVNNTQTCSTLTASNGYFSCNVGLNTSGSITKVTGSIIVPQMTSTVDPVTGNTIRTSYQIAPVTGAVSNSYTNITQTLANSMSFSVNLGMKKIVSTCPAIKEQACTFTTSWVKEPISVTGTTGTTVVNAGSTPLPSPAVK